MNTRTVQADAHQGGTGIPEMKNELRICRENLCGSLAAHQATARHLHELRKKCHDNHRTTSAGKADNSTTQEPSSTQ
jgi:protein-tyrosine-phosphatase